MTPGGKSLYSTALGTVMMTTELVQPDMEQKKLVESLPTDLKPEQKIFRQYLHIIPDREHQIFKLVDQI